MGYPLTPLKGLNKMRRVVVSDDATSTPPPATPPQRPAEPPPRTEPDAERMALADQIILAGKRRRGEICDDPPPLDPKAAAILKAGRVRRGEEP